MRAVNALLKNIKIPLMYKIKQEFVSKPLNDIEETCLKQIISLDRLKRMKMVQESQSPQATQHSMDQEELFDKSNCRIFR